VYQTITKTITYSSSTIVTKVIPVTQTQEIEQTVDVTVGSGQTVTQESLTVITVGNTVIRTTSLAPVTSVQPTTRTTTSSPATVTAAANTNAPTAAFIAGVLAAMAMF
jgi:hypothetical protein